MWYNIYAVCSDGVDLDFLCDKPKFITRIPNTKMCYKWPEIMPKNCKRLKDGIMRNSIQMKGKSGCLFHCAFYIFNKKQYADKRFFLNRCLNSCRAACRFVIHSHGYLFRWFQETLRTKMFRIHLNTFKWHDLWLKIFGGVKARTNLF